MISDPGEPPQPLIEAVKKCGAFMDYGVDPPLEAKGAWPDGCETCSKFLAVAGFTHEKLVQQVDELHSRVAADLQTLQTFGFQPKKSLKRKSETEPSDGKRVKQEHGQLPLQNGLVDDGASVKKEHADTRVIKQEPPAEPLPRAVVPSTIECQMGKAELMVLHGLVSLDRGAEGKKCPVKCAHCVGKVIEGRNRAKIWQHVQGRDHRMKWAASTSGSARDDAEEPHDPFILATASKTDQKCPGLRLSSKFGRSTRLGSDLRSVWDHFTKFAYLQRMEGPNGQVCHTVTQECNSGDWILKSTSCSQSGQASCPS